MYTTHKRKWWQRSLDRSFRMLEGEHGRIRDPIELQQEIATDATELRKETDAFTEKFQQDIDSYVERLKNSIKKSSPLWTPLPTWGSWKKKKKRSEKFEIDRKIIDGRIVRGGLVPGGGRVHMIMEEKLVKIEEKRNMSSAHATQISSREAKRLRNSSKMEPEGWVPKVAGGLGTTRPANREAFLSGWEMVGKRLGRVKLGGTRVST